MKKCKTKIIFFADSKGIREDVHRLKIQAGITAKILHIWNKTAPLKWASFCFWRRWRIWSVIPAKFTNLSFKWFKICLWQRVVKPTATFRTNSLHVLYTVKIDGLSRHPNPKFKKLLSQNILKYMKRQT